jgi:glycerol-3-phosphate dehydrogenase
VRGLFLCEAPTYIHRRMTINQGTSMTGSYDLVVIGAGSGGVRAARMAATYGARVAIIEELRV